MREIIDTTKDIAVDLLCYA